MFWQPWVLLFPIALIAKTHLICFGHLQQTIYQPGWDSFVLLLISHVACSPLSINSVVKKLYLLFEKIGTLPTLYQICFDGFWRKMKPCCSFLSLMFGVCLEPCSLSVVKQKLEIDNSVGRKEKIYNPMRPTSSAGKITHLRVIMCVSFRLRKSPLHSN